MTEHSKPSPSTELTLRCLTYCPLPYNGQGPAQSCVSILENFPTDVLTATLMVPRSTRLIGDSVIVEQTLPLVMRYLPWRLVSHFGNSSLNRRFLHSIDRAAPRNTIVHFWPAPPLSLVKRARVRGLLTVREMINTFRGTAKKILDRAYEHLGLIPGHKITEESVDREREELSLYDFVFAPSAMVEASLLEANVPPARILQSSFGWSPLRSSTGQGGSDVAKGKFRALFVGTIGVRKGVLQLLAAWKQSGVAGELVLAGKIEDAIKPLLKPYLDDDSIRFVNFTPDVGSLYKSADIFVFPTLEEGGPQVIYEAAGCGLPVVTTPMGIGRLIQDRINGLIIEPNDIDGLATAISLLANSPVLRERLSRRTIVDAARFTYENIGFDRATLLKFIFDQKKFQSS